MHLITFREAGVTRVGTLKEGVVADLRAQNPSLDIDMLTIIDRWTAIANEIKAASTSAPQIPVDKVELLAPIPRPRRNLFCVGKNYFEHAREFHKSGFDASAGNTEVCEVPIIFSKTSTTVVGPGADIPGFLDPTKSVDYEIELGVVIGKGGRGISRAAAFSHVFGYTIINDVTSRTLQQKHRQWFLGKNIDGFCPMGPSIVTADEVPDVSKLRLVTRINSEIRQDALVSDMIFDIPYLIETISSVTTLEPGDIIATGTPAGVGIGFKPPRFLVAGDEVSLMIEPIGILENRVV